MTFNIDVQNNAISQADTLQGLLNSAISDLKTAASSRFIPKLSQLGFDNNPTWEVDRGREVTLSGLGDLPEDRPTLVIPGFTFNPGDLFPPDLTKQYSYISEFFDNFLEEFLVATMNEPSQFIAPETQQAIFDQTRERDIQTLNDAQDAVDRQYASQRGFPSVIDDQNVARQVVIKNYTDIKDDRNKEETALVAKMAQTDTHHAMDVGVRMEDIRSRFQLESSKLYWKSADWLISKYETDVRSEIARFSGELDLMKADTAVKQGMSDKDLSYESLDQEKERARLQASFEELSGNVTTWAKSFDGRIRAAAEAVIQYSAEVSGWLSQTNAINYEDTSPEV